MTKLKTVCPVSDENTDALPVRDLAAAIRCYEAVLGFSVTGHGSATAVLTRDDVRIGLIWRADHEANKAGSIAFEVTDLEAMHQEVQKRGGNPGEFGVDEWGGKRYRTFFLREVVNGYCYCFYSSLETG